MHVRHLAEHADSFKNEAIVLMHISKRFKATRALELLKEELPESLKGRVFVALGSHRTAAGVAPLSEDE